MKKFYSSILFFIFLLPFSFGQSELACDGVRYVDDVFSDVEKTTVTYGSNTNILGFNQNLQMDIYEPVGDVHQQRPVIIFAFGGSFLFGFRSTMEKYCEQFARKGYVAATIDYRLGFTGFDNASVTGAVMRAVSDMKAAVRYFRWDADTDNNYKVHPDYILVGGYSAGAFMALHTAYLDEDDEISSTVQNVIDNNGGFEGDTGDDINQSYSSEVFAVYNLSGALQDKIWLDENETEPLVSYHGTEDATVPYNSGVANGLAEVDGSGVLHMLADDYNIPNYLKTVNGGGHSDIHSDLFYEADLADFESNSHIFLQNQMCPDFIISTSVENFIATNHDISIFPNPSNHLMHFDFGEIKSDYHVQVFDQLGRMVIDVASQNDNIFTLGKNEIGEGVFFVNVLFDDFQLAPLKRKIIFN